MSHFLSEMKIQTAERIRIAKNTLSEIDLYKLSQNRIPIDFLERLKTHRRPRVIAEIKRQSPTLGFIAPTLDPIQVAVDYVNSGAAALSVLTEPTCFGGNFEILKLVREALPETPLLIKDFVLDPYQLLQAKAFGADAVLLIHALLGEKQLKKMMIATRDLGLTPLVEVHDSEEMTSTLRLGANFIGVNNRNLKTLSVSLSVSRELVKFSSNEVTLISESGIESIEQINELSKLGFDGFLIGSALMKTQKPGPALATLLEGVL
jgi:indole-3-glycerol phosphate synthase